MLGQDETMRNEGSKILAERFDAFLLDLDGVVYLGDELLPGSREALARLRKAERENIRRVVTEAGLSRGEQSGAAAGRPAGTAS